MRFQLHYSLQQALLAILLIALTLAGIRFANDYWASGVAAVAFLLLLTAIVAIIYRRGQQRAVWLGAAIFGWFYWLSFYSFSALSGPNKDFPVTQMLRMLYEEMELFPAEAIPPGYTYRRLTVSEETVYLIAADSQLSETVFVLEQAQQFVEFCHSLVTLWLMMIGALIGSVFHRTMCQRENSR